MKLLILLIWLVQSTLFAITSGLLISASKYHKVFRQRRSVTFIWSSTGLSSDSTKIGGDNIPFLFKGTVDVVSRGDNHVVVSKPASVVVHHRYVLFTFLLLNHLKEE